MAKPADELAKDVAAGGTGAIPLTSQPDNTGGGSHAVLTESQIPDRQPVGVVGVRRRRRTSLAARGQPMVWLTGGAATLAILMIVGLIALIAVYGFSTFWPQPVSRVTYVPEGAESPATLAGEHFRSDTFVANEVLAERDLNNDGELTPDLQIGRTLWRTGNRDLSGTSFTWVDNPHVQKIERPEWMLTIERDEGGRAFGEIEAVAVDGVLYNEPQRAWNAFQEVFPKVRGIGRELRDVKSELGGLGEEREALREQRQAAEELEDSADALAEVEAEEAALQARETELNARIQELNEALARYRIFVETVGGEILPADRTQRTFNVSARTVLDAETAANVASIRLVNFTDANSRPATADDAPMGLESTAGDLEGARVVTPGNDTERPKVEFLNESGEVIGSYVFAPRAVVYAEDGAGGVGVAEVNVGTRIAVEPLPLTVGQIVRAYPANRVGFFDKIGIYLSRWWEFLSEQPRDANQEGGVLPAIVGTVLLTFIMIVFAVPIGVVAAIYLREYAKQGPLVSLVRISVNNLAGVPSIVYGVFGLGFFVYGVGGWVDGGATGADQAPLSISNWVLWIVTAVILVAVAIAMASLAGRSERGAATDETAKLPTAFKFAAGLAWAAAAIVVFYFVFARIPTAIFPGFFPEQAARGEPEFKEGTILWAALTLALLTLPVVIVATEEALAAVPRSMREGSYACGASKWQTIQRIVLPRALPGVMTGAILAISRGAGEVAPIMLVGALKLVRQLPVNTEAPFIHVDQAFMHLGFHIFDLGFQSPDAEAARSMVYTTTLLLILIVVVLNLSAIWVRSRLRRAFAGGQF